LRAGMGESWCKIFSWKNRFTASELFTESNCQE
jgi:hypothetical protein